jgi:hypothetical protein
VIHPVPVTEPDAYLVVFGYSLDSTPEKRNIDSLPVLEAMDGEHFMFATDWCKYRRKFALGQDVSADGRTR